MQSLSTSQDVVSKKRSGATINVYLVLRREESVLLSLRQNTGYSDGYYGLVSGHVEDGESAITAALREAEEEAGLLLAAADLTFLHLMHRKTNRFNVDLFFECSCWQGTLVNKEPLKCEQLCFHELKLLPENIIPYIKRALVESYVYGNRYSEEGWV